MDWVGPTPYRAIRAKHDDVAKRKNLKIECAEQATGRLVVDALPLLDGRGEQCRQTNQRTVNLEQLAVDDAFHDECGILQGCVRDTQRGLPHAFDQKCGPGDQCYKHLSDTKDDGCTESLAPGRAVETSIQLKVVGGLAGVSQYTKLEEPFWTQEVPALTQGRVPAEIHPFDRSGLPGQEMLQLMRLGVVPFGTALLAVVSGDEPELNAVDLPTLNPDMGRCDRQ
jgi:hypothetical protein